MRLCVCACCGIMIPTRLTYLAICPACAGWFSIVQDILGKNLRKFTVATWQTVVNSSSKGSGKLPRRVVKSQNMGRMLVSIRRHLDPFPVRDLDLRPRPGTRMAPSGRTAVFSSHVPSLMPAFSRWGKSWQPNPYPTPILQSLSVSKFLRVKQD